jgi:aerobic C4-dicarboxylate transport protein
VKLLAALKPIYVQVLIAVTLAIIMGVAWPDTARAMKPLGDAFIALLSIVIGPIIFTTVVLGFAQIRNLGRLGRVAIKSIIYFEVASTLALIVGMVAANVFEPGSGLHVAKEATGKAAASIAQYQAGATKAGSIVEFFMALIPKTFFSAFAEGNILQILILAVMFGAATVLLTDKCEKTLVVIEELQGIVFKILSFIMRLAPLGAFGAMAYTVGTHGGAALLSLAKLMLLVYATSIFFVVVVLGAIARMVGLSIFKIMRMMKEELLLGVGTSSTEVVLPRLLEKLEQAGCEKSVVGLVVPASYTFNVDGTAIYMSMSVVFISQATDTPLSIVQQLSLLAMLLLTSKGGGGFAGASFAKLAATLQTVPTLPLGGMGVLIGVDRFMSEARAFVNLVGTAVATLFVAKWEGAFDKAKFDAFLLDPSIKVPVVPATKIEGVT